ncbi:MAG: UDP-N-acetylmuramate dehydrogenase [Prevotella sp.]|nr:UDP-N-acetylmuramate dehydrogenase [Prevotella sp.]
MKNIRNYSLLGHNTFGIDATCDRFVEFSSVSELLAFVRRNPLSGEGAAPLLILGGGSNLLLTGDFHGTVVHSAIMGIECISSFLPSPSTARETPSRSLLVRVGSGVVWDDFVAHCVDQGWHGAENLSLIPGEVGASAVQNIGAYGVEAADLIERVEAVELSTGRQVVFEREECRYGYRQSRFKQDWKGRYLVTHVTYRLSTAFEPKLDYGNIRAALAEQSVDKPTPQQLRQTIIAIRQSKLPDPQVLGNGGSFFMNPVVPTEKYRELAAQYPAMPHYEVDADHVKIPAGWLIEQCGWKGRSLGQAGVHDRQALVLVNLGGATGSEIVSLCDAIRSDVSGKFGIDIRPEVNIV